MDTRSLQHVLFASVLLLPFEVQASTSFTGLGGFRCGQLGSPSSGAFGVSADGSTVVGASQSTGCSEAFTWTEADGFTRLGHLADPPATSRDSEANGVSADGSVVVGTSDRVTNREAFRWTADGGMVGLGDLPGGIMNSLATAVSADGSVVVGESSSAAGREAMIWTAAAGMVGLGVLPSAGFFFSTATDVSANGEVVVGQSSSDAGLHAFRWTAAGGMQDLGHLGFGESNAYAVSADGEVVVGTSFSSFDWDLLELYAEAFRWTAEDGMLGIGFLPGWKESIALAVSADGNLIVGFAGNFNGGETAIIWDPVNGMRSLQAVLIDDYGIDLTGWNLLSANAITPDGSVIAGVGFHNGVREAWVAAIPEPGTSLLLGLGLLALGGVRSRRSGR